jgi:hypothetical protein
MTQAQLNSAVARRTGESIKTVRRRGFGMLAQDQHDLEPEEIVLHLDCPFCGRPVAYPGAATELAACDHCDLDFDFDVDEVYTSAVDAVPRTEDVTEPISIA